MRDHPADGGGAISAPAPRLLVVDAEPLDRERLLGHLRELGHGAVAAEDGRQAWALLQERPEAWDMVLVDRDLPGLDGIEVLRRIKAHPVLEGVPVILQTRLATPGQISEGIRAGAWYYLTKPFGAEVLGSVLETALADRERHLELLTQSELAGRTFALMSEGRFRLQTLEAARDLAAVLAEACPEPRRVVVGLSELLINAVEHGNLEISYTEKGRLRESGCWEAEIARRLAQAEFSRRWVAVEYRRTPEAMEVVVRDQGPGFDWRPYMELSPERDFHLHGRGIAMARLMSFDHMEYRGRGNEVAVRVLLRDP